MAWKQPIPTDLENEFGEDWNLIQLYKELIYRGNNEKRRVSASNGFVELERGQVLFGSDKFATYLGHDRSMVRRNLKKLETLQKVTLQVSNRGTIVSICNYDNLVKFEQQLEQQVSNSRATGEQQLTPSKSVKSEKIEEIETNTPLTPEGEMPLSADSKIDWDFWESTMTEITRNKIFQRNALIRLSKSHGREKLHKMIKLAAIAHVEKYTPMSAKPSSPKDLETKWDALALWGKSKFVQSNQSNTIVI